MAAPDAKAAILAAATAAVAAAASMPELVAELQRRLHTTNVLPQPKMVIAALAMAREPAVQKAAICDAANVARGSRQRAADLSARILRGGMATSPLSDEVMADAAAADEAAAEAARDATRARKSELRQQQRLRQGEDATLRPKRKRSKC